MLIHLQQFLLIFFQILSLIFHKIENATTVVTVVLIGYKRVPAIVAASKLRVPAIVAASKLRVPAIVAVSKLRVPAVVAASKLCPVTVHRLIDGLV